MIEQVPAIFHPVDKWEGTMDENITSDGAFILDFATSRAVINKFCGL